MFTSEVSSARKEHKLERSLIFSFNWSIFYTHLSLFKPLSNAEFSIIAYFKASIWTKYRGVMQNLKLDYYFFFLRYIWAKILEVSFVWKYPSRWSGKLINNTKYCHKDKYDKLIETAKWWGQLNTRIDKDATQKFNVRLLGKRWIKVNYFFPAHLY